MYLSQVDEIGQTAASTTPAAGSGLIPQLQAALGRGLWTVAIGFARLRGMTNENELTDMIFFARNPNKRRGQPLSRAEQLEWIRIRNEIVRPALARPAAAPVPAAASPSGTFLPVAVERPGGGRVRDLTEPSPGQLVTVRGVGGKRIQLHHLAAAAWQALVDAARAAGLASPLLLPTSGYRSRQRQEELWRQALKKHGSPEKARKWVAPPGGSAHQTGRAIDFYLGGKNSSGNAANLLALPAYKWLAQNARRFGFYPYEREPWHWEYNPPA